MSNFTFKNLFWLFYMNPLDLSHFQIHLIQESDDNYYYYNYFFLLMTLFEKKTLSNWRLGFDFNCDLGVTVVSFLIFLSLGFALSSSTLTIKLGKKKKRKKKKNREGKNQLLVVWVLYSLVYIRVPFFLLLKWIPSFHFPSYPIFFESERFGFVLFFWIVLNKNRKE